MKSMKLYTNVQRIHNELAALGMGPDAALRVDQLTPFDQYHYFGTDAVDEALEVLQLQPGSRVLDVGSGIGGPARYIAAKTGAHVTALELQPDLHEVRASLRRAAACHHGLSMSAATFLMVRWRKIMMRSFHSCVSCIFRTGHDYFCLPFRAEARGVMYIEDFGKSRPLLADEAKALSVKVQCAALPGRAEYEHIWWRQAFLM